jgi:hypothetical protein
MLQNQNHLNERLHVAASRVVQLESEKAAMRQNLMLLSSKMLQAAAQTTGSTTEMLRAAARQIYGAAAPDDLFMFNRIGDIRGSLVPHILVPLQAGGHPYMPDDTPQPTGRTRFAAFNVNPVPGNSAFRPGSRTRVVNKPVLSPALICSLALSHSHCFRN